MDIALIAAKILGVYLVVSGLFLIVRGKTVPHLLKDFFEHPAIVYLTGAVLIFLSLALILQNNVWDGSWRMAITIFAWLVFLKGVAYMLVPDALHKFVTKRFLTLPFNVYGVIAVAAGIALFYLG